MLLDSVADVAEVDAGGHLNADAHALMAYSTDTFGLQRRLADQEHFAGVAVVALFDDCDINVDDVAVLETFVAGNSVANLMINRGANGFGKPVVVEWRRDRLLLVDNVPMTDVVQLTGGDTRHDMRLIILSTSAAGRPATLMPARSSCDLGVMAIIVQLPGLCEKYEVKECDVGHAP